MNQPTTTPRATWRDNLAEPIRRLAAVLIAVVCCQAALSGGAVMGADWPAIDARVQCPPVGTFLLSRNSESATEDANASPGHWNHVGVVGPNGYVLEGQAGPGRCIATPFSTYYARYPELLACRPEQTPAALGVNVAAAMVAQLGHPYRRIANNCVKMAARAAELATGEQCRWRRPDHVLRDAEVVLWQKNEPTPTLADPFAGSTMDPSVVMRGKNHD